MGKNIYKRITKKKFFMPEVEMGGTILKSDDYMVTLKFDNNKVKLMTRFEFNKRCRIIENKKRDIEEELSFINETYFKEKMDRYIRSYLKRNFKNDEITLTHISGKKIKVNINGNYCGKLKVSEKGVLVNFEFYIPPPEISQYLYSKDGNSYIYIFTDTRNKTKRALGVAINWLLLSGKEKSF